MFTYNTWRSLYQTLLVRTKSKLWDDNMFTKRQRRQRSRLVPILAHLIFWQLGYRVFCSQQQQQCLDRSHHTNTKTLLFKKRKKNMFFTKSKTGNNKSGINILKRFKEFFLIRSDAARSEKKLKDCISTIQKLALRKKQLIGIGCRKKHFLSKA